jgi:hypothetical protein
MTRHIWTSVTCDADDRKEMVVSQDANARQVAERQGWALTRRSGRPIDLCPAHKNGGAA